MAKYTYNPPYNQWSGNRSDTLNKWKVNYKGSIATASALPDKGEFKGDTYNVLEDGSNYMWNGNSWDKLDANVYVGSTATTNGIRGLVPPATAAQMYSLLTGMGTWQSAEDLGLALDEDVVHLTGDETIDGAKFHSNSLFGTGTIQVKLNNVTRGTAPSEVAYWSLAFVDENGYLTTNRIGLLESVLHTDSTVNTGISAYKNIAGTNSIATVGVGWDVNNNPYGYAPSTRVDSSYGEEIVTRDWIPKDTRIVHTTGNENIAGVKTFTNQNVYINSASGPKLNLKDANASITGSSIVWTEIKSLDNSDNTPAYIALGSSSSSTGKVAGGLISFYVHQANVNAGDGNYAISFMTSSSNNWLLPSDGVICLGGAGNRWKQIYSNNTTISTSDERLKNSVDKISDDVLDAWDDISWSQFKFNESVKEKGNDARLHTGLIAQDIDRKFKQHNLNVADYGLFCYDEWEDSPEERNDNGEIIRESVSAGNRYSIRYEEALCMEAAYQRRRAERAEARIKALEDRLEALEARLA